MEKNNKLKIFGLHEDSALDQMNEVCKDERVIRAVLCADGHIGYSIPIGGVVSLDGAICPNGVGFDIACGNKAVRLDCNAEVVRLKISHILNQIRNNISFGVGGRNNEIIEHELFERKEWSEMAILRELKDKAQNQLGTIGAGNHYIDIFTDEHNRIWVGVHCGSRGFGHTICSRFIKAAGGKDGIHAEPIILKEDSDLGEQYLKCMHIAGEYAYAGRDWICKKVAEIVSSKIVEEVHNHHNFAWKENHFGKDYWVIRKGATPAFPGQKSFVGGSMGDISVILEGVESEESKEALYSTIHGAGRIMGRMEAKGKINKKGIVIREGKIKKEDMDNWIKSKNIKLLGGYVDEAPQCYKRIEEVLEAHKNTIKILHTLTPIGVCMA